MSKERALAGEGVQHYVYEARTKTKKPMVLKVPKLLTGITSRVDTVRQEVKAESNLAQEAGIKVPHTRVFKTKTSYIIAQEKIVEDHSVDIGEYIKALNNPYFLSRYEETPANFASNKESVYLLDLTKTLYTRIMRRIHVDDLTSQRISSKVKRIYRGIKSTIDSN